MKAKHMLEANVSNEEGAAAQAIAALIRQGSKAGQLISGTEIYAWMVDQHLVTPHGAHAVEDVTVFKRTVEENEDLHEVIAGDGSRRYYSSDFMTDAYATLLLQKQGDHLRLIAETVRENSAMYPRPLPLDFFTHPPFDFTRQQVLNYLERMMTDEEYRDILTTTTSASSVFLFSRLHLEPEHASMLAEWLDVGQSNNP